MAPKRPLKLDMLLRRMPYGANITLAKMLDSDSVLGRNWMCVAAEIVNSRMEPRYCVTDLDNFALEFKRGGSPTIALLKDWATQEATVHDLIKVLEAVGREDVIKEIMPDYNPMQGVIMERGNHQEEAVQYDKSHLQSLVTTEDKIVKEFEGLDTGRDEPGATALVGPTETQVILIKAFADGVHDYSFVALKKMANNFHKNNKLGEGGFGTVYYGKSPKIGDIAIKVLKETDQLYRDQFKNELKHLSRLQHVNIASPIGYSFDGPLYCLVYTFMPNGSLEDYMKRQDDLPWKRRLSIARNIADGICYLHSKNIVHRDIKSANVLLDENIIGKVADFGLVRDIGKDMKTILTQLAIGSPVYMSPEATRGDVSPKLDVFSYGVVLLELITGMPPMNTEKQEDIVTYYETVVGTNPDDCYSIIDKRMTDWTWKQIQQLFSLTDKCLNYNKLKRIEMEKVQSEITSLSQAEQ